MGERVLVAGRAGFIGWQLVDALLEAGHEVRVFDNLEPQLHGGLRKRKEWRDHLAAKYEKVLSNVRDREGAAPGHAEGNFIFLPMREENSE